MIRFSAIDLHYFISYLNNIHISITTRFNPLSLTAAMLTISLTSSMKKGDSLKVSFHQILLFAVILYKYTGSTDNKVKT